MRLIDADTLMDCIDKNCDDSFAGMFKALVKRQPTAFDKEKVINEIHISSAGMAVNMNVSSSYAEGYIDAAKYIIEIVEKGGIE